MDTPDGVEVTGPIADRFEEILSPRALELVALLQRELDQRREELLARRVERSRRLADGRHAGLPPGDRGRPGGRLVAGGGSGAGAGGPARGDHRADRPQDDHQRAQLRRQGVAGRLRGRQHPAWENVIDGQLNLLRRDRPATSTSPARRARSTSSSPTTSWPTIVVRPRGWHLPEKHLPVDGEPTSGVAGRLRRCTSSTTRSGCSTRAGARTSTCPRWSRTSRRGCGTTCSTWRRTLLGIPRGHHPGHRADRDATRPRSRWRRSSTSCATTRPG